MLFDFIRDVVAVIGVLGVVGGAAAALAYWLFKTFAGGWLKAQFDKDLAAFTASKDQELERLRAEIGRLADRATRFHEKEYEVLPAAWGLLNRAHGAVGDAVSGLQRLPDLDRMTDPSFAEFLQESDLLDSEKAELRAAAMGQRGRVYSKMRRWKSIANAGREQAEFQNYVILNGIFIEDSIAEKMGEAANKLRMSVVTQRIAEQDGAGSMFQASQDAFDQVANLVAEIKADVKARLWTIQMSDER
jgi:hypothetical protein